MTLLPSKLSNWTKNSVLSRLAESLSDYERAVSIESISSIKIMDGLVFLAASNTFLSIF